MSDKSLIWLEDARDTVRAFPDDVRKIAGFQLCRVQSGLEPNDWKPMPSVGLGAQEIRVHTGTDHRVLYVTKFAEAVYILHAFEKRTRRERRSGPREAAPAPASQSGSAPEGMR